MENLPRCLCCVGSSTDDLIALRMLYNYANEGRCKLLGVVVNREEEFFDLWPKDVDIVFSPMEVGNEIEYKPETVIQDISWTDIHPIKQVYMTYDCNTGQRMWDPLTVIQAVEGDALFSLSERGIVTPTEHLATVFTPLPTGNCRYQKPVTKAWFTTMLDKMRVIGKP